MKNKILAILKAPWASSLLSSIFAVILGLLVGFIILLISNYRQAVPGFLTILRGGITGGGRGIGQVIYYSTPIMMTGLSVAFAFKNGLFNIGAPGQFIVGAFAAIFVGVKCVWLPAPFHWMAGILAAFIAGGLWALIPAVLKAYLNVNEVISTIMMNYIGMYGVNYAVSLTVYDVLRNQSQNVLDTANIPKAGFDVIMKGSSANGGFFVAVIVVILIYIILEKTTFGFELKACGLNKDASKYAGINEHVSIVSSFVIAGALAGLGGALLYLSGAGKHMEVVDVLANEGFIGIPVALLGLSHPIGVLFAALFIAYITVGGFYMQIYEYTPEVIEIIISSIIYFSAFALVFKRLTSFIHTKLGGE